jgi:glycosyltransferase involved in cell wall biosynthesis
MTIPTVSVVVPTYNRAASLGRLLRCIARQSYQHFECLVIDDGSNDQTRAQYEAIWPGLDTRFRLYLKSKDDRRFGPARSRNRGIELAQGAFIAFCDDDDLWIRDDHLTTAVRLLTQYQADFFFANMQSSADGVTVNPNLYSPTDIILRRNPLPGAADVFEVSRKSVSRFLESENIHSDTLVVARQLFEKAGLYWEDISEAEDYEMVFRLADQAQRMIYRSGVVGDLDVSSHTSVSHQWPVRERVLFDMIACLRAEILMTDSRMRRSARTSRAWRILELANLEAQAGRGRMVLGLEGLALRLSAEPLRIIARSFVKPFFAIASKVRTYFHRRSPNSR